MRFFLFWRENALFPVLVGICVFWVLVEKCGFTGLAEKMCFNETCVFYVFCGKMHLAVLAEKCVFPFLRENVFSGFGGKMYLQKNKIDGLKITF